MKKIALMVLCSLLVAGMAFGLIDKEKDTRAQLVENELNKYNHHIIKYNASNLHGDDKNFLAHMLSAANLVEEINMLQITPDNPKFREQIKKHGSRNDLELYHRNQSPWCLEDDNVLCNALESLPPKRIGWNFWPEGMKESDLARMERLPNAKALLSPFTFVRRDDIGKYFSVPFVSEPFLTSSIKELANELRTASSFTDEPTLKNFLVSRADALESKDAYPYDKSDYDWIAIKGPWEITVGPYETYKEPMRKKAQFEMFIARIDPVVDEKLAVYRDHLQEFENHLASFIGKGLYKPRKLDSRIALRAVRLIYASGDGRSPHGATVAYHLPNRGKAVEEGLYKKVLLVNHMQLFTPLMQKRAKVALIKKQKNLVDGWADIMNTVFHEFLHGFGAHENLQIKGRGITVENALGPMETLMEELKADVGSLWFIPYLMERGLMDKEEVDKRYATAILHLFGLLQYSLNGTYPQMAAIEIGYMMENGVLSFDEKIGKFTIHFDLFKRVIDSLMRKIVTIQLTGDRQMAEKLRNQYVKKTGEDAYEFKPLLAKPIASLKKSFDKEELKSFAIDYKVKGL